jgi:hypothetical protein
MGIPLAGQVKTTAKPFFYSPYSITVSKSIRASSHPFTEISFYIHFSRTLLGCQGE